MNRLSIALLVATSVAAALPVGLPLLARTTQASQSQGSSGPGLGSSRVSLADGMRAEASVLVTKPLLDPESGATVVPVCAHIEVLFGGVTLFQSRLLELPPRRHRGADRHDGPRDRAFGDGTRPRGSAAQPQLPGAGPSEAG